METESKPKKSNKTRLYLRVTGFSTLGIILIIFLTLWLGLKFFGEKILREYLQERIHHVSKGLYKVDFDRLEINVLNGNIKIYGFHLKPDTSLYNRMKEQGKADYTLYDLSYKSMTITRLHLMQLINLQQVNIHELRISAPEVIMVAYPDSVSERQGRFTTLYKDLYPLTSRIFQDFHIDSVKVDHGLILLSRRQKTGKLNEGEYEFSANLQYFTINRYSYYNRERVFYSKDIDIVIHNYAYSLADSLYFLNAEEVGFSLTRSHLYGKNVRLIPNFGSKQIAKTGTRLLFRVELPAFSIRGIDLYQALMGRKVEISSIRLEEFTLNIFRNSEGNDKWEGKSQVPNLKPADLYNILRGKLESIDIDTLSVKNAFFAFYPDLYSRYPELSIERTDIDLLGFYLDSTAHLDRQRVFYARDIELMTSGILLRLRDNIHSLKAAGVAISTIRSAIEIRNTLLFPGQIQKEITQLGRNNLVTCQIPDILFHGIDLKKLYHRQIFDFKKLEINEPDLELNRIRHVKNPNARFKNAIDFFEEENEDVVYNLFRKYLHAISGKEIEVNNGYLKLTTNNKEEKVKLASGSFHLALWDFLIDSASSMNSQGYFYSRDFDFAVDGLQYRRPDGLTSLTAEHLHILTQDSLIEINHLSWIKNHREESDRRLRGKKTSIAFEMALDEICVKGLNHRKLFLEKKLQANSIRLLNPRIQIASEHYMNPKPDSLLDVLPRTEDFFRELEMNRLEVLNGDLEFENTRSSNKQSFSLKRVNFIIRNPYLKLPRKGIDKGKLSFDSLQLSVKPMRAAVADSAYEVEFGSLSMNSYPVNIILTDVGINPLGKQGKTSQRKAIQKVLIPYLAIHGFYFDRALFDQEWNIDSIVVKKSQLDLNLYANTEQKGRFDIAGKISLPPFMHTVRIGKMGFGQADLNFFRIGTDPVQKINLSIVDASITGFSLDSVTDLTRGKTFLDIASDYSMNANGITWVSDDSLYQNSIKRFGFSTSGKWLSIDSLVLGPRYSREEFTARNTFQHDRINVMIPFILLSGLDFNAFMREKRIIAGKIELNEGYFEMYRDKRLPLSPFIHPPNPLQRIVQLKTRIDIDSMVVNKSIVTYYEKRGPAPGMIYLDEVFLLATGITNNPLKYSEGSFLVMQFKARLMGKGLIETKFCYPLVHRGDSFTVSGKIGAFNLTDLNPMITNLLPVRATGGRIDEIDILDFRADTQVANGNVNFFHHGLQFKLLKDRTKNWNTVETGLLNLILNQLIPSSNPGETGNIRRGIIYFRRDPQKGFINYVWKGIFSGLKSGIGLNDEVQRKIFRSIKNEKRDEKQR